MDTKLISVIIPVYNVERFLEKCLESVLNQTYENLEIILVDDGSTDSSSQLCDKWKAYDQRIIVVHKGNGGLSDARNTGLDIAKGDFYVFIDSDDYISLNMIETMMNSAINNSCEISICNMIHFSEDGYTAPFYCPVNREQVLVGEKRFQTLNQPSVCNKLFQSQLFENIRFPIGKYYEDTYIYHELLYRAKNVVLTGSNSYWYLVRSDSIIGHPKYSIRYFDFVEAVYYRASFLLEHKISPYAYEACLSFYAAMANVYKNIEITNENKELYHLSNKRYAKIYKEIKKDKNTRFNQKIRLFLLRYLPNLHAKLY